MLIAVLLVAGVAAIVVHHPSSRASGSAASRGQSTSTTRPVAAQPSASTTTTTTKPTGTRRLVDANDHLSLEVPAGWQVASSAGALSDEIQAIKSSDPQLAAVADQVLAALNTVQVGVFALDAPSGTVLYTYGTNDPGVTSVSQVSSTPLVTQLKGLGATNIVSSNVSLPIGSAKQVSAQVVIGGVPVAEVVDLLVLHKRVVVLAIGVRGSQSPAALVHQIQSSLASA
jgi:hypothetical protein